MSGGTPGTQALEVDRGGWRLAGEVAGKGPPIVLCHGLTATRRYVVHGSRALPRAGFHTISYDARGHGASDPPPEGGGYSYAELADDLAAVVDRVGGERRAVLAGHPHADLLRARQSRARGGDGGDRPHLSRRRTDPRVASSVGRARRRPRERRGGRLSARL